MAVCIRMEAAADRAAIAAVTTAAFRDRPYASGTEAAIVDGLRQAGALMLSLVAIDEDGDLIGHIGFSPVTTDMPGRWLGIGPLSVRPDRQKQGVGSALVRAGLDRLRAEADGFVLVGDPDYYGRFGFTARPGLTCDGVPDRYVQGRAFTDVSGWAPIAFHPASFVEA
jgi:putative acetyltransferase